MQDGVFAVTRAEVRSQKTSIGYLLGDRWLDGGSAGIAVVSTAKGAVVDFGAAGGEDEGARAEDRAKIDRRAVHDVDGAPRLRAVRGDAEVER